MHHLHCNETALYNKYKIIHSITDFPKLNAQVHNAINAKSNATSQPLQQLATQAEVADVMDTAPMEETTIQAMPDFTTFAFGAAGTPNPAPTPPNIATTTTPPDRTDLNDHLCPENTYDNNRTSLFNYTQYAKQVFHLFYNKMAEPICLAYLNTFVYSGGQFKMHTSANKVKLQLKKLTEKHFVTSTTEGTQMLIDEEQIVD
eukprot:12133617-Ditylum_brightwellii.AAC.1